MRKVKFIQYSLCGVKYKIKYINKIEVPSLYMWPQGHVFGLFFSSLSGCPLHFSFLIGCRAGTFPVSVSNVHLRVRISFSRFRM